MAEIILNVEVRERTGTGGARETRRAGKVPGVLYGGELGPVPIAVKYNEFRKALFTGKLMGHLVTLKHGSETQPVIARDIQMHPVTDQPWHFDLYRVKKGQLIRIGVAVHFTGQDEAPGIVRGGTLNVVLHEVEVSCPADQIPEHLEVSVSALDIGDAIRISDLKLPAAVQAVLDPETVVATLVGAQSEETETTATAAAEGAEAAEGEAAAEGDKADEGGEKD
jgi:large subunit ribosomal protein L25